MRELFVTELVMKVLGPRNSPPEVFTESLLTECLTGALASFARQPELVARPAKMRDLWTDSTFRGCAIPEVWSYGSAT